MTYRGPRDVVPRTHKQLTDAQLLALHDGRNSVVTITEPGELLLDEAGVPSRMGPPVVSTAALTRPRLTEADEDRLIALLQARMDGTLADLDTTREDPTDD